jgi:ribonuclease Z
MNPVGTSSVAFVTLSGLFWGGWMVGSQTPQGQEALAKAYEAYAQQQAGGQEQDLFAPNALRALVCGASGDAADRQSAKPCLAVAAAGRLFVVDAGSGAAQALEARNVPLERLESVLLTGNDPTRAADLDTLWVDASTRRAGKVLPVYGPTDSHRMVMGMNNLLKMQGVQPGLQPWSPAPEPGAPVIVFEGDGLTVMAFTTAEDALKGRVGYRFDYRGRSLVVGGDGRAEWAQAAADADVVLHGAQSQTLAQLHDKTQHTDQPSPFEVARAAHKANAGMLVLTGVDKNPLMANMQLRQAKEGGLNDVVAARMGLLLELPLTSREVLVRPL